jgi:hypothetical protein
VSPPEDWTKYAACAQLVELGQATYNDWYPRYGDDSHRILTINQAKRVCKGCPVRKECLELAMKVDLEYSSRTKRYGYGIWAGYTGSERWAIYNAKGIGEKAKEPSPI